MALIVPSKHIHLIESSDFSRRAERSTPIIGDYFQSVMWGLHYMKLTSLKFHTLFAIYLQQLPQRFCLTY